MKAYDILMVELFEEFDDADFVERGINWCPDCIFRGSGGCYRVACEPEFRSDGKRGIFVWKGQAAKSIKETEEWTK